MRLAASYKLFLFTYLNDRLSITVVQNHSNSTLYVTKLRKNDGTTHINHFFFSSNTEKKAQNDKILYKMHQ